MHCTWTHAEVITRISLISVNEEQLSFEKGFNHLSNAMISYSIFSNVFNFSEHCHWAPRHRIVLHLLRRPLWKDHERSPQPIKMMINCPKRQCGITFDIISDKLTNKRSKYIICCSLELKTLHHYLVSLSKAVKF